MRDQVVTQHLKHSVQSVFHHSDPGGMDLDHYQVLIDTVDHY